MITMSFFPVQYAYISSIEPKRCFKAMDSLFAGTDLHGNLFRTLIRFDLSTPPGELCMSDISMNIFAYSTRRHGSGFFAPYSVLSDWDASVTWGTQPSMDLHTAGKALELNHQGWYCWDITEIALGWFKEPGSNRGLMICSAENGRTDLKRLELQRNSDREIISPCLNIRFQAQEKSEGRHVSECEILSACDDWTFSSWQNTSCFSIYTFFY